MKKLKPHIPVFHKIRNDLKRLGHYYAYDVNSSNMCGLCAVSSYIVFLYLSKHGFKPKFMLTDHHCWIEVENYYIDLTATQYGIEEEVLIKSRSQFRKHVSGKKDYKFADKIPCPIDFKEQVFGWSNGQNPGYLEKKSKIVKQIISAYV